ncbi:beta/gamma crystallin domain-containing protein 2-like [Heterodontus francisci]|uniref:beta/gamma crystallin domain-containing protein 2-like n=1 Tax=Heterodontus francisci TaxID=7792 RepID=UPI00355C351B
MLPPKFLLRSEVPLKFTATLMKSNLLNIKDAARMADYFQHFLFLYLETKSDTEPHELLEQVTKISVKENRCTSFSESDLRNILNESGSLGEKVKESGPSLRSSLTDLPRAAAKRPGQSQKEKEDSEARTVQEGWLRCPDSPAGKDPSELDSRQCPNRTSGAGSPESRPVKHTVCFSTEEGNQDHNISDTQHQTSSPIEPDAQQKLPDWAEILNTHLDSSQQLPLPNKAQLLESTINSPGLFAETGSKQSLGASAELLHCSVSQSRDKTAPAKTAKTKYDIIITLTKEEVCGDTKEQWDERGLVWEKTGVQKSSESETEQMAGRRFSNHMCPSGRVLYTEECQRYAVDLWGTPLGSLGGYAGLGYSRLESSPLLGGYIPTFQPWLSPRESGYSRCLQQPPSTPLESRTGLLKLVNLPRKQAGGLVSNQENTQKVEAVNAGTMITNTDSQTGAETDMCLSSQMPLQVAGSPDSSLTNSSSQPSMTDSKQSDDGIANSDEGRAVNGSDHPLSGSPTERNVVVNIGSHTTMNSVLDVGRTGADPVQQTSKEARFGDVLQNVNLSGVTQQINTLYQQSPEQIDLVSNTLCSPTSEKNVHENLKMDQGPVPQPIENTFLNCENIPLQNTIKSPFDSFNVYTAETPVPDSKSILIQNPTQNSKDFQAESSIVVNPNFEAQTFKYRNEKTGSGEEQLQPTGSPILENELSSFDIFIQNQRKRKPANISDDPDRLSEIDGFADTIRNLDAPMLLSRNQRAHSISFFTLPPIEEDQTNPKNSLSSSNTEKTQQLSDPEAINGKPLPSLPTQPVSPLPSKDFSKTPKKEVLTPAQMLKMQLNEKPKIGVQRTSAESSIVFRASHLGKTNLEIRANSENKETLSADRKQSRLSNTMLFSNSQTPMKSFSSKSLDCNLKSTTASSRSPLTTLPNLVCRSLSFEDVDTTTMAMDQLPPPTFLTSSFEGSLLDTRRPSLPSGISDRLMAGYSSLSDTSRNFQSHRISLPSDLDQHTIANRKPGKVTAFPDAWKCKPKEQGKTYPRPGKILVYDKPNFTGFQREIRCDVPDCSSWQFPAVISVRVVRGCWVAYEKPNYKGKKVIFAEEDVELVDPWSEEVEEETEDPDSKPPPSTPIVIGSLRIAVRDYTTPQISLFSDANGEGKKLMFYGESEDIRIFGYPPKTTSIIVNSGLWFVYSEPFFEGQQCSLDMGPYRTLEEWGAEKAQVGSLMPLQMGPPRVEKPYEPKISLFEKPYFTGRSREVYSDSSDFLSRYPNTGAPLSNAASIKVDGGIWIGYSKEGFRGHQYLLEEGEYLDWKSWGGCDEDLKSLRLIRANFSNPAIAVQGENSQDKEDSMTLTKSVPDLEQTDSGDAIKSMKVLNGVWVAYEGVNYSGAQYILEKGIYRSPQDWGAENCKISSLHPILLVEPDGQQLRLKIQIFAEFEFSGRCLVLEENKIGIPKTFKMQSCRVLSGSWALYEGQDYDGRVFVVGEGEYPDLQSMGCRMTSHIRSLKAIPHVFSQPSLTLYSLENFEGKEIELDAEVKNLISDGYNNMVLSLRVSGGVWVAYEHSNFRGRQVLLEPIEISNWPRYSSFSRIGSLSPVLQKCAFFQITKKESDGFLSVTVNHEDAKSTRVIFAPKNKELEQVWFFEKGLLKPKFAPDMSLQTIGTVSDAGNKVVLWSDKRIPRHCWTFEHSGTIQSLLHKGFVLDIKGGKSYDWDSAMICKRDEENPSQLWEIQML